MSELTKRWQRFTVCLWQLCIPRWACYLFDWSCRSLLFYCSDHFQYWTLRHRGLGQTTVTD